MIEISQAFVPGSSKNSLKNSLKNNDILNKVYRNINDRVNHYLNNMIRILQEKYKNSNIDLSCEFDDNRYYLLDHKYLLNLYIMNESENSVFMLDHLNHMIKELKFDYRVFRKLLESSGRIKSINSYKRYLNMYCSTLRIVSNLINPIDFGTNNNPIVRAKFIREIEMRIDAKPYLYRDYRDFVELECDSLRWKFVSENHETRVNMKRVALEIGPRLEVFKMIILNGNLRFTLYSSLGMEIQIKELILGLRPSDLNSVFNDICSCLHPYASVSIFGATCIPRSIAKLNMPNVSFRIFAYHEQNNSIEYNEDSWFYDNGMTFHLNDKFLNRTNIRQLYFDTSMSGYADSHTHLRLCEVLKLLSCNGIGVFEFGICESTCGIGRDYKLMKRIAHILAERYKEDKTPSMEICIKLGFSYSTVLRSKIENKLTLIALNFREGDEDKYKEIEDGYSMERSILEDDDSFNNIEPELDAAVRMQIIKTEDLNKIDKMENEDFNKNEMENENSNIFIEELQEQSIEEELNLSDLI
jgi:hypothetical protein